MASRRSPPPLPCSALTGTGSPRTSDHSQAAPASAGASSTLLAARTTDLPDRLSTAATAASASVTPTTASVTNSTASAASTATLACAATRAASTGAPSVAGSQPPGPTTVNARPLLFSSYAPRYLVTPGVPSTTD